MAKELIGIRVNELTLKSLRLIAKKQKRSLSEVINKYLDDSVNRTDNKERKDKE